MKTIELTQGQVAIVDDEDYEVLNRYNWYARNSKNTHYAVRVIWGEGTVYMHRFILTPSAEQQVDHINGNGLDNRRENLRICTRSQNQHNRKKGQRNSSGFKGVSKKGNKWQANIGRDRKQIYLGIFDTPDAAHEAYVKAAKDIHGEFANS
jgi:hypothetical protein